MRTLLRRLQVGSDAGLSLLEVVIAMLVFAVVSIAVIHSLISTLTLTRDNRNREIAANLAAQEIDLARDASNIFNLQDATKTVTLNGENFSVVRTTSWVSNPDDIEVCGQGGSLLKYKLVDIQVEWEHMREGSEKVAANTVISPNTRINNPLLGTILVSVMDAGGNGSQGVAVTAVPTATNPNGAQTLTAVPAATDAQGCSYILQVAPGNYTVTVSKTNYITSDQSLTASQDVTVTASTSTSASFSFDLKARFQVAYFSSPAPFGMIPRDLTTSFFNEKKNYAAPAATSASFSRNFDLFPWDIGYTILAGKYREVNESDGGCLSPNPAEWADGNLAGVPVTGVAPTPVEAAPGATVSAVAPMGAIAVSGVNGKYLRATTVAVGSKGPGDPGCAVGMTFRTDKAPAAGAVWLYLPYGTWKIESNSNDVATGWVTVGSGSVNPVTQGQVVSGNTVMLDPRVAS